jgi:hypothetical protein
MEGIILACLAIGAAWTKAAFSEEETKKPDPDPDEKLRKAFLEYLTSKDSKKDK